MVEVESWVILNFFTTILLVLLLVFQNNTSRLQKGRKYSAILICTIILLICETIGRIGELHPDRYLFLAQTGYFLIFLLDPVDILFAVYYMDCWMDDENHISRNFFRKAFEIFSIINIILVTISSAFDLRWFFYFDDGVYFRGQFFLVRAVLILIFIFMLSVYAIAFRKNMMSEYKTMVLCLPVLSLIGALLQIFLANLDATYAGISLGCLILFFFFQSRDVNVDYLSGVLNRRGLDIKMQDKVKASLTSGKNFSAIMMDIDNFKEINDQLGHEEGDKAIKIVASLLVDIFGQNAIIGRFGGDEFCIIVEDIPKKELEEKVQEVHVQIAKMRIRNKWPSGVDVSCGFQKYDPNSAMTAAQFQKTIDRLMYLEKQEHHRHS
ncbi:MAG: GGDEF domain-containing protein [Pseudobutyrivibrio sp.]|nr:GGDEF domain-containing protein [Pseudobutyrivibrio sp.]